MAQENILRCLGLVTQYNPLSVQSGALSKADNAVIDRENVVENRRGYLKYATLGSTVSQVMSYRNRVVVQYGTSLAYDNGSGTFSAYSGSYSPVSGSKMRQALARNNMYVTTSAGVKVFSDVSGTAARLAGAPRSLDPSYTLTGSTGFLSTNSQVAYRCAIVRTDANSNQITGYPSQRLWVTNSTGGARNAILTLYLPSDAISGDVVQFYRTAVDSTGATSDTAGDTMNLAYQVALTSADISAGLITFTDSIVDALLGAPLYTNSTEEGIAQANAIPPLAKDLAFYRSSYLFYANTQTKQRLFFTLVGTGALGKTTTGDTTNTSTSIANVANTTNLAIGWKVSGTGIPASTTITNIVGTTVTISNAATATNVGTTLTFISNQTLSLAGTAYSFGTSEITSGAGSPQVQVSVTGTAAVDIDLTARSLVRVINRYASNTSVYAYYLSGPDDLPGQIQVEEKGVGASSYKLQTSSALVSAMVFPLPPVSPLSTTESTSSNETFTNRLYYSKADEPEHVPLLNYVPVGPSNTAILRVAALRDSLIIIKEEGVYRLTGDTAQSFAVTPLDLTVYCKAADSVVVLQNQVYMLSNQGVVSISDTGVEVVSREIEDTLKPILSFSNLSSYTYAVSYESDRAYILSTMGSSVDTAPTQIFRFNIFTKAWTKWSFALSSGIVEPNSDKLYFSKPGESLLYSERKNFDDTDYADPEIDITIISISGTSVTFSIAGATPTVGWGISQLGTTIGTSAIETSGGNYVATLIYQPPNTWGAGAGLAYPSVGLDFEWNVWSASQPGYMKQVQQLELLTDNLSGNHNTTSLVAAFKTDLDQNVEYADIDSSSYKWGPSPWGGFVWGGISDTYAYPAWPPQNKSYGRLFFFGVQSQRVNEHASITGLSITYVMVSERVSK